MRQAHAQRRAGMMERRQARAGRLQQVRVLDTNRDQALDRAEIGNRMPRPRSDAPARPLSAGPVPRVYFRAAGAMGKSPARV